MFSSAGEASGPAWCKGNEHARRGESGLERSRTGSKEHAWRGRGQSPRLAAKGGCAEGHRRDLNKLTCDSRSLSGFALFYLAGMRFMYRVRNTHSRDLQYVFWKPMYLIIAIFRRATVVVQFYVAILAGTAAF
jgi:hypothetical protein